MAREVLASLGGRVDAGEVLASLGRVSGCQRCASFSGRGYLPGKE